jgi:hypothetical protein
MPEFVSSAGLQVYLTRAMFDHFENLYEKSLSWKLFPWEA